jgi:hypothetical protein
MAEIDTDYLVVGAGAAGLAFADTLVAHSDADVVIVDRREQPAGHWNDVYPFVQLHSPSACYGVETLPLGSNQRVWDEGPDHGFYERATAHQLIDYFHRVCHDALVGSGRVRFLPATEHQGGDGDRHRVVSLADGEPTTVRVGRRLVDATWFETDVPSTHTPSFQVDPDAHFMPINDLVELDDSASGYTVIGAGKTGIDACLWLMRNGVDPGDIRWVKPRDAWHLSREHLQPLELLPDLLDGQAKLLEAAADAEDVADLLARLEACDQMRRVDPEIEPTMYRCAMVSAPELDELRRIDDVVRLGRVRRIDPGELVLDEGTLPVEPGRVHVDCSARGLRATRPQPIFEPNRITIQQVRMCQPTFNAALVAFLEASDRDDAERNHLTPPNPYPSRPEDWLSNNLISNLAESRWSQAPDVSTWLEGCRLNLAGGLRPHLQDPEVQGSVTRIITHTEPALANLARLLDQDE